jgi:hypothetical protein
MSNGHLTLSESPAKRARKAKAHRKTRTQARSANSGTAHRNGTVEREPAAIGSLTRTKALLLAALRVWELKHRIGSD